MTAKFDSPQTLSTIKFVSQGGFCPKEVVLWFDGEQAEKFEAQDSNHEQILTLSETSKLREFSAVKLEFTSSTDFFGRVILYKLELIR